MQYFRDYPFSIGDKVVVKSIAPYHKEVEGIVTGFDITGLVAVRLTNNPRKRPYWFEVKELQSLTESPK